MLMEVQSIVIPVTVTFACCAKSLTATEPMKLFQQGGAQLYEAGMQFSASAVLFWPVKGIMSVFWQQSAASSAMIHLERKQVELTVTLAWDVLFPGSSHLQRRILLITPSYRAGSFLR